MRSSLFERVGERLGGEEFARSVGALRMPRERCAFACYLGGLAAFLFAFQVLTGILLMFYYRPGAEAYASMQRIVEDVPQGAWIRTLHSNAAHLMVLVVLVHLASVFYLKAYRAPREFTWLSGLALSALLFLIAFCGYVLPMDDHAYGAARIGTGILAKIPWVGPLATEVLLGGQEVTGETAARFFVFHVSILPALFVLVLAFHLWLIHVHGMSQVKDSEHARHERLFPDFFRKELLLWGLVLGLLSAVAVALPAGLGSEADPMRPASSETRPEWYLLAPFVTFRLIGRFVPGRGGEALGVLVFLAIVTFWIAAPFVDPSKRKRLRSFAVFLGGSLLLVLYLAATIYGIVM